MTRPSRANMNWRTDSSVNSVGQPEAILSLLVAVQVVGVELLLHGDGVRVLGRHDDLGRVLHGVGRLVDGVKIHGVVLNKRHCVTKIERIF